MDAPPPAPTIRALLTKLRDEMILEAEMERASRPPAQTARFGTLPPVRSLGPAGVALKKMMIDEDEDVPVPDEDLVEDHPLGRMPPGARVPEGSGRRSPVQERNTAARSRLPGTPGNVLCRPVRLHGAGRPQERPGPRRWGRGAPARQACPRRDLHRPPP